MDKDDKLLTENYIVKLDQSQYDNISWKGWDADMQVLS